MRLGRPLLASLVLLFLCACGYPWRSEPAPDRAPVGRGPARVTRVTRGDITSQLVFSGDLRPKPGATAVAKVSGRLERLYVEPGSAVREGDTLAELDRTALEVQVVQGQANLAAAEARLAALQTDDGPDARAEADARLRAARARLASLESSLPVEAIPALVQNLREARTRLIDLETNNAAVIAHAEARLTALRGRLDQILTAEAAVGLGSPTPVDRRIVDQARSDIRRAEEDLARARRPISGQELAAARQDVAQAEDQLLLARNPVGPGELEEARANLEAAEVQLRRSGTPASPTAVKAAESAVEYAWAALELARLQLRESTILSPIAGVVVESHQVQGVAVAAGTPLLTIQPPDYELVLPVEDRHLSQLRIGMGVTIAVDAYAGESFNGTLRSVAPTVDPRTRTVAARVDVLDPQLKLKSGLFAQASISGARRQNVLLVPREAVVSGSETTVMQVVDGRARRHPVQIGLSDGRMVEITQGLPEGAEVLASPAGLADGDLVGDR